MVSGNIEVIDAPLAFKISGRVVERTVDEGERIEAGALVARLDATVFEATTALASALGQMINLVDPDGVVIGGGLGTAVRYFDRLRSKIPAFIWAEECRSLPILSSRLKASAGVVGAAVLHVGEAFGNIGDHLRSLPETVAVYCLGGTTDFLVHVVCRDTEHLRRLTILSFTSRPEVSRIETSLVFSYTRLGLPVDHAHGVGIPQ